MIILQRAKGRSTRPCFGALMPTEELSGPPFSLSKPVSISMDLANVPEIAAESPKEIKPLEEVNLLEDIGEWPVRDQYPHDTCVAHAVAACVELARARQKKELPVRLSTRFLHQQIMATRQRRSGDAYLGNCRVDNGNHAAKLCEAADVLATEGICTDLTWPKAGPGGLGASPSGAALDEAKKTTVKQQAYADYGLKGDRPQGVARMIYDELAADRPVAICVPGFRELELRGKNTGLYPTTLNRHKTMVSGLIPDPLETEERVEESGHAVCVVGFQPTSGPSPGYFIFRNSWGTSFGNRAGVPPANPPRVPAPGYGAISALYVEYYCWEWLSLDPVSLVV